MMREASISGLKRRTNMSSGLGRRRGRWNDGSGALAGALLVGVGLGLFAACSGDDDADSGEPELPTGEVSIEVSYPTETAMTVTAVVHAWVLAERPGANVSEERAKFNCASLIGGTLDPYDLTLVRLADVAETEELTRITASHVAPGDALVYVEAGGFDGEAEFAGCSETTVGEATVSASVQLSRAKIFDCADPDTEEDSPCDDGRLCTVGETCQDGECRGGAPRDCSFGADSCHAGTCDEETGCSVQPLANGTPCDDDLFCTQSDVCSDGECVGAARDCADDALTCEVAIGCDEQLDECVMTDAPFGTTCDDGLFCTVSDQCDGFGSCTGSARDCFTGVPQCQQSAGCDEALDQCATVPQTLGTFCDDGLFCTGSNDQCDGLGACVGGTPVDCSGLDDECNVGVCDDTFDTCDTSPRSSGTACNVGLTCTADTCDGLGSCSTATGSFRPASTVCDDGDVGTTGDVCDGSGTCAGTL